MNTEKSCGAVVFTRVDGEIRYVLAQSLEGFYGFPKGHVDPGETEHETALREIREEVGLRPTLIDGFRVVLEHPLPKKPGVIKQVVYFLAEYADQDIVFQKEELLSAPLLSFDEAMVRFTFDNSKQLLTQANDFLRSL